MFTTSIQILRHAYNKLVSISNIAMGEEHEHIDPSKEEQRKRQLTHVKQEEEDTDNEKISPETNRGILKLKKQLKAKVKKPCC